MQRADPEPVPRGDRPEGCPSGQGEPEDPAYLHSTRIVEHVHVTRDLWPAVTEQDLHQISGRLSFLGDKILHGERNMTELCAVALALLVDMEPRLKGERQAAIGRLIELMESLNREFDGRLENHDAYAYAAEATNSWYAQVDL